jgi:hypothetical protein
MRGRLGCGLLCLVTCLFTSYLAAEPMHFEVNSGGGNCDRCEWIQATGEITDDSATVLIMLRCPS